MRSDALTTDDIDEIGRDPDPAVSTAELVAAVDQDRIAAPPDVRYALMLAGEITEKQGDLEGALALADRAIAVHPDSADDPAGHARAFRAELLGRSGRDEEATAAFAALRPLLVRDPNAAYYLSESMESCGRAETAEQWLTAAFETAVDQPDGPGFKRVKLVYSLVQARFRIRRGLGLPSDENDDLAVRMRLAADGHAEPAFRSLMFWPRDEFDRLVLRWPSLTASYGQTWDEHRTTVERAMVRAAESGETGLAVYAGSTDGLVAFAARNGTDPGAPAVCGDYEDQLERHAPAVPWPPGRNDSCWCQSSVKYKKCCLPRKRD